MGGWICFVCGFLKTSSTQGWKDNCYPDLVISYIPNKPNQSTTYRYNSLNIMEIEWLSIDEYHMNIIEFPYQSFWIKQPPRLGIVTTSQGSLKGLESKLWKNGWLIYGSIEPLLNGSKPANPFMGGFMGGFILFFYIWKGLTVTACCFFSAKNIIDSHRPLWNDSLLINDFMGWDFFNGFRSAGWQKGDPGEIFFCGAICVEREREREWETEKLPGCAWVFRLEYHLFMENDGWW